MAALGSERGEEGNPMQGTFSVTTTFAVLGWARTPSKTQEKGQAMKVRVFRQRGLLACATAFALSLMGLTGDANAQFPQLIPTRVGLVKFGGSPPTGKICKLVSKAPRGGPLFALPTSSPATTGGSLTVTVGAGALTCDLAPGGWNGQRGWKGLGNPEGAKGYKYVNKGAPDNDPCKVVMVTEKAIKLIAMGTGTIPVPLDDPPGNPDISTILTLGDDDYCAYAAGPHSREIANRLIKVRDQGAPGACVGPTTTTTLPTTTTTTSTTTTTLDSCPPTCCDKDYLSFETGVASGTCGEQRNFRCSNDDDSACVDDGDCDFGTCLDPPGICLGDVNVACSGNGTPCTGSCGEIFDSSLPRDLDCGRLEFGGGVNSGLLRVIPDRAKPIVKVTGCNSETGELTLGPTTPGEVGQLNCTQGRTCDSAPYDQCMLHSDCPGSCLDNCLFGPPLPIPDPNYPATSVCLINVVAEDASGTAQCSGGAIDVDIPPVSVIYLTGDLLKASAPPDVPGIQPCPLCDKLCQTLVNKLRFPCDADSDCPGGCSEDGTMRCFDDSECSGTCTNPSPGVNQCGTLLCVGGSNDGNACTDDTGCPGGSCGTQCLGGIDNGDSCMPETSNETVLGQGFPTSHDCRLDPYADITETIGGLRILTLSLSSGMLEENGADFTNARRVFCGFCQDLNNAGSLCFEGNTDTGCPAAIPPADGSPVPCTSDAECADGDEYESCAQRSAGALGYYAATRITLAGSAGTGCLGDGQPHPTELVGFFCVPPTFDNTADGGGDFPGPGTATLQGSAQLQ